MSTQAYNELLIKSNDPKVEPLLSAVLNAAHVVIICGTSMVLYYLFLLI
jgi:hypothetical protein